MGKSTTNKPPRFHAISAQTKRPLILLCASLFLMAHSSAASPEVVVCTNYEQFTTERVQAIADFLGVEGNEVRINPRLTAVARPQEVRFYVSPLNEIGVTSCIESAGLMKFDFDAVFQDLENKIGSEVELAGGARGTTMQSSQTVHWDGIVIRISASIGPEPYRSILAMTSTLGIDDTLCLRSAECMASLGEIE